MAFQPKIDYFGLTSASQVKITDSNENKSAQVATGVDEKGDVRATTMYGIQMAPSCSYVIASAYTFPSVKIGDASISVAGTTDKFTITNINITTTAGQPPTIEVTGQGIPSAAASHNDCTYTVPSVALEACHHAQRLFDAFTSSYGEGNYLTAANYTVAGDLTTATKDGEIVSFDIANGRIEANVTIVQTGSTAVTCSAGSGFLETSPLTKNDPDGAYPTWTATFTKYLVHDSSASA